MFAHVGVGLDGSCEMEVDGVCSHELAERVVRVCLDAGWGPCGVWVVDVERVHVPVCKLCAVDLVGDVAKEAACLCGAADVDVAHGGGDGLFGVCPARHEVEPVVLLWDGEDLSEGEATCGYFLVDLVAVEACCVEPVVEALVPHEVCGVWGDLLEEGKDDSDEVYGERLWVVSVGRVLPPGQEVCVPVWGSCDLFEILDDACDVEFCAGGFAEREMDDVVGCSVGHLYPLVEGVDLDEVDWPVVGLCL